MENMSRRLVVGCGNLFRRDDGLGIRAIEVLRGESLPLGVELFDSGTSGLEVIFQARDCRELVIIDACRSGSEAGSVFRVPGAELSLPHKPTLTLHDFRWDHALYAGKRLFGEEFPQRVTAFLVEGSDFGFGDILSTDVARALPKVVEQVVALLWES
jgi:hydrogenase maturation protease